MGSIRRTTRRLGRTFGAVEDVPWSVRRNLVITGQGRSGATLTCYLLNTVAASEPINPGDYLDRLPDNEAVVDGIQDFYRGQRRMAFWRGLVVSKHVGGVVPDN